MWRYSRCVARAVATALLAMVSVSLVGCIEQPLKQLPKVADASKDQGSLAGVSWSVMEVPDKSVENQAQMVISQHLLADQQPSPSPAWLDLHGGTSRAANREPDILRQEF